MDVARRRGVLDWVLEGVALMATLWGLYPVLLFDKIAEDARIPTHYNMSGVADGWGDKSMLWLLSILVIVTYVGLTLMERFYKKFNYPTMQITMNYAVYSSKVYRLGVRMVRFVKPIIIILLAYLSNNAIYNALSGESHINQVVLSVLTIALLVVVFVYIIKMIRAKYNSKSISKEK